jgi:hypothetical protein
MDVREFTLERIIILGVVLGVPLFYIRRRIHCAGIYRVLVIS